jgi:TPR repeat protein
MDNDMINNNEGETTFDAIFKTESDGFDFETFDSAMTMDGSLVDNDSLDTNNHAIKFYTQERDTSNNNDDNEGNAGDDLTIKQSSNSSILSKFMKILPRGNISKKMQDIVSKVDNASVYEFGDEKTSLGMRQLIKDAHSGDRECQFTLGYCYDTGKAVEMNTEEAIFWYTAAANKGHVIAQNNLGVLYTTGHNGKIQRNAAEALHWYKLSAKKGNPNAQFHCGLAHLNGEGLEQRDDQSAFFWFKKAAKQGHSLAMSNVGAMYLGGRGVEKNFKKAYKWLLKAVETGDMVSKHNLGVMYLHGLGGLLVNEREGMDLVHEAIRNGVVSKELSAMAVKDALTLYNS